MGYAVANSKPVIFVDEKKNAHTEWLKTHCLKTLSDFGDGIEFLKAFSISFKSKNSQVKVDEKYINMSANFLYKEIKNKHLIFYHMLR